MNPLSVFSGPYAFLARMGVFFLTLFIAIAFGFYEGWKWERPAVKVDQDKLTAFAAQVKTIGDESAKTAAAKDAANQKDKEQTDAQNATAFISDAAVIAKLRHDAAVRSGGHFVPQAAPAAKRPYLACFDRTALESALGKFVGDVRGLADEGAKAALDLNSAKTWAKSLQ